MLPIAVFMYLFPVSASNYDVVSIAVNLLAYTTPSFEALTDWEAGRRKMPEYLFRLMHYKIQIDKLQTKASCEESEKTPRNVNVICDAEGKKIVLINDIRFKGKSREEWNAVEKYLIEYVGSYHEIEENSEIIATNETFSENIKKKHEKDAKLGWYRYDVRFALPVYDDKSGELVRYNIFSARMLVRHADDGKKYLYDLLAIKKETSSPL